MPTRDFSEVGPGAILRPHGRGTVPAAGRVCDLAVVGERLYAACAGGGVWRSNNQGRTWLPTMDGVHLRRALPDGRQGDLDAEGAGISALACNALAVDPQNPDWVFAGTGNLTAPGRDLRGVGILHSKDGGGIWHLETIKATDPDLLGAVVFALCIEPGAPEHCLAATSRGLYRRVPGPPGPEPVFEWERVRLHAARVGEDDGLTEAVTGLTLSQAGGTTRWFAAQRANDIVFSDDYGGSWNPVATEWNATDLQPSESIYLAAPPNDINLLYALSTRGRLQRAQLGGGAPKWKPVNNVPAAVTAGFQTADGIWHRAVRVDPHQPNSLLVAGSRHNAGTVPAPVWAAALYHLALDPQPDGSANTLAAVAVGLDLPPYLNTVRFGAALNEVWVVGEAGIHFAPAFNPGAPVFEARHAGLAGVDVRSLTAHPSQEAVLFSGTRGASGLRYVGDAVFSNVLVENTLFDASSSHHLTDCAGFAIHAEDPFRILAATTSGAVRQMLDGGADPSLATDVSPPTTAADAPFHYAPIAANHDVTVPADADWVAWGGKRLWTSDQFGNAGTWVVRSAELGSAISCLVFAKKDLIYAGCENGEIYRFKPGAALPLWDAELLHEQPGLVTANIDRRVSSLVIDPGDENRCYATFAEVGSHDSVWFYDGATWHSRHGNPGNPAEQLPRVPVHALAIADSLQHLFVGCDLGVWESENGGQSWAPTSESFPEISVTALHFHSGTKLLRAATAGRGIAQLKLDEATPGVRLLLRDHLLDVGYRTAYGLPKDDPTDNTRQVTDFTSPDIIVDSPDGAGHYASADACPDFVKLAHLGVDDSGAVADGAGLISRVHVRVLNTGHLWAHGVQVHLFIAKDSGAALGLPSNLDRAIRSGSVDRSDIWHPLGKIELNDVVGARPAIATFELPSQLLVQLAGGVPHSDFVLLAIVHHPEDEFEIAGPQPENQALATGQRHVALKKIQSAAPVAAVVAAPPALVPPAWTLLGPSAILRGQSATKATMSGRIADIAISADGQRVFAATANGGLWRSVDRGQHWQPMDHDTNPTSHHWYPRRGGGVDTLSCGAVALIENYQGTGDDRLYLGTGERGTAYYGIGPLEVTVPTGAGVAIPPWTAPPVVTPDLEGQGFFEIAVDPTDPDRAFGATTRGLYIRDPGTGHWTRAPIIRPTVTAIDTAAKTITVSENFSMAFSAGTRFHLQGNPDAANNARYQVDSVEYQSASNTTVITAKTAPASNTAGGTIGFYDLAFTDQGKNFSSVVAAQGHGVTRIVAAVWGGLIYESSDHGASWNRIRGYPTEGVERITLTMQPTDPDTVFALNNLGKLHRVRFAGVAWGNWVEIENMPGDFPHSQENYNQAFSISPNDANLLYIGGSFQKRSGDYWGEIYRLRLNGNRINDSELVGAAVHPDIQRLRFRPGRNEVWVGCDGGLFLAADAYASGLDVFVPRNTGLATMLLNFIDAHPNSPNVLFSGTQDNGGLRYLGDEAWRLVTLGDGGYAVVHNTDPHRVRITYTEYQVNGFENGGGAGIDYRSVPKNVKNDEPLFYAPMRGSPAGAASTLAFGTRAAWISKDFGDNWRSLPAGNDTDLLGPILEGDDKKWDRRAHAFRSLAFANPTRLFAGTMNGGVYRFEEAPVDTWARTALHTDPTPAGPPHFEAISVHAKQPITAIAIDWADPNLLSIYVAVGGGLDNFISDPTDPPPPPPNPRFRERDRIWHYDGNTNQWRGLPGSLGHRFPGVHVNALIVDPNNPAHIYAGTDIGVFHSPNSGTDWDPFSLQLPDASVIDFSWHNGNPRLLRASTFGRGVFEFPVDAPNVPPIELYLRSHQLDAGREGIAVVDGDPNPADPEKGTVQLGDSPDIKLDTPSNNGTYQFERDFVPTFPEFVGEFEDRAGRVAVSPLPVFSRVYVQVHNRGQTRADNVEVVLLVGDDITHQLPADYVADILSGRGVHDEHWDQVGIARLEQVAQGLPGIAKFHLGPGFFPSADEIAESGTEYWLLLLVFDRAQDPFLGSNRDAQALCRNHRQAACKKLTLRRFTGTVPGANTPFPEYIPYLLPLSVALRAREKLVSLRDEIQRKGAAGSPLALSERTLQILADQAVAMFDQGNRMPAIGGAAVATDVSRFVLLGCAAWDLVDFAEILEHDPGWLGNALRRGGGPDGNYSQVLAPTARFVLEVARRALASASEAADKAKIRAFAQGMIASLATQVTCGPLLRGLALQRNTRDWDHATLTFDDLDLARRLAEGEFRGVPAGAAWQSYWPEAGDVPDALWEAIDSTTKELIPQTDASARRFHETRERGLAYPDSSDLEKGYALFRRSMGSGLDAGAWFGILTPLFLLPPFALLIARTEAFPEARHTLSIAGPVNEKSWYDISGLTLTFSTAMPFAYGMALWSMVPRRDYHFIQALVFGLVRLGLIGTYFGTRDTSKEFRWGFVFSLALSFDVYFMIWAIVQGARSRPGSAILNVLQMMPIFGTGLNLLIALILHKIETKEEYVFWPIWITYALASWLIPSLTIGFAIAGNGGLIGLLKDRGDDRLGSRYLRLLEDNPLGRNPPTRAALFPKPSLWKSEDSEELSVLRYPSGRRPLVAIWWEGAGDLEISHDRERIVFRTGGVDTPVELAGPKTVTDLVPLLTGALAGVGAKVVDAQDAVYPLPAPQTLADPGDDGVTIIEHESGRDRFVAVSKDESNPYLLEHAPRSALAQVLGVEGDCAGDTPYRVLPENPADPIAGTGLDQASDLAALLGMAGVPDLAAAPLQPANGGDDIGKVYRVFRNWNLDERQLDEWRRLFTGGVPAGEQPEAPEPDMRAVPDNYEASPRGADIANALGWVHAFKAWRQRATDTNVDVTSDRSDANSPTYRVAGRAPQVATHRQLDDAIRYLMDIPQDT